MTKNITRIGGLLAVLALGAFGAAAHAQSVVISTPRVTIALGAPVLPVMRAPMRVVPPPPPMYRAQPVYRTGYYGPGYYPPAPPPVARNVYPVRWGW